jgi:signal transduction histidine kinase
VGPTQDRPPVGAVRVTDELGQVVASSPEAVDEDGEEDAPASGDASPGGDEGIDVPVETATRIVEAPTGDLTITADTPVDQVARNIDALTRKLAIGLPALVALVGAIAWALVGRALRPVEAIRAEVDEITGSTMHRRVPEPPTRDEVGRLARTMNAMLSRLDTSATRQRQFVSDASHELSSPVAAIRTVLEVARHEADPANWPAVVDDLLAEESRLEARLDDLLLLAAHDENGTITGPERSVNLTALTMAEARRPRRVPVDLVHTPADNHAAVVAGAADQLARALSNMVDNAARHATSVVHISLSRDARTVRVIVDDDGPGIPRETANGSSNDSRGSTTAAPDTTVAAGSDWPSSTPSSPATTARSGSRTALSAGPVSSLSSPPRQQPRDQPRVIGMGSSAALNRPCIPCSARRRPVPLRPAWSPSPRASRR